MYNLRNSVLYSLELKEYILGRICEDLLALKLLPLLLCAVTMLDIEVYLREDP
jgi:hypothetical protein